MRNIEKRLDRLISLCKKKNIDGYMISTNDEYLNEYTPNYAQRLKWLTNFSGSNGIFFLIDEKFIFFTDGRYTIQARKELPNNFKIFDLSEMSISNWIEKFMRNKKKKKILIDSRINSIPFIKNLDKSLKQSGNTLILNYKILVDEIKKNTKNIEEKSSFLLPTKISGLPSQEKIKLIKKKMGRFEEYIITSPESVCWLLNIRGSDLKFTPIIFSRILISKTNGISLYVVKKKLNKNVIDYLNKLKIKIFDEDDIFTQISNLSNKKVLLDKNSTYIFLQLLSKCKSDVELIDDLCKIEKSTKNEIELKNNKKIHLIDAVAIINFMFWLENQQMSCKLNEFNVSKKLEFFRAKNSQFFSPSFTTISASGENAAIIHYSPNAKISKNLNNGELFLFDSGGQYPGGTTDVTRTIIVGKKIAKKSYIDAYTRVLKGHLNLAMTIFPKNTRGIQLDAIARYNLWNNGMDYNHGTGHGVGSFLGVHEGPQSISKSLLNQSLKKGMIISNEPGYYEENKFGIRIESLVFVKDSKFKNFYEFETLTMVPFERELIDKEQLDLKQIKWINNYHSTVFEKLSDNLDVRTKNWLATKTLPI